MTIRAPAKYTTIQNVSSDRGESRNADRDMTRVNPAGQTPP
jgi:hypothetical protein